MQGDEVKTINSYILRMLIAVDQFFNTLLGGLPDETISSRWGRTQRTSRIARWGCVCLGWLDPGHCPDSIEFTLDGAPDPHHLKKGDGRV